MKAGRHAIVLRTLGHRHLKRGTYTLTVTAGHDAPRRLTVRLH